MSTSNILFQQKFDVVALNDTGKELDKGESGKKFERGGKFSATSWVIIDHFPLFTVNRLSCRNSTVDLEMIIGKSFL